MDHEAHGSVTAAAEPSALAGEVAGAGGRDGDVGWVALADLLINVEAVDDEAVRDIVGDKMELHGLAWFQGDLRRRESETVRVDFDGLRLR